MKVLVPIKRVVDANFKVRVKSDQTGMDLANAKMAINPFCEIALEQAVRLKETAIATEVLLVCIGPSQAQDILRTGLAIGADRAILLETDAELESLAVAKLLKAIVEQEQPSLVLTGKQAIDSDNNQTGQMLAALLGWPQGTFASQMEMAGSQQLLVTREVDGGLETLALQLPAVVTADLRLNEPRYASLPNIMKAKRKPLTVMSAEGLGVDVSPRLKTLSVSEPPARKAGIKVANVTELLEKLKTTAQVI